MSQCMTAHIKHNNLFLLQILIYGYRKLGVVREFIVCLVYMNCCVESLIVEVNEKLCDLSQSLSK